MLAADPDPQDLLDCVRAGAVGYVSSAVDSAGLGRIVRAVSDNEAAIPRAMVLELLMELRTSASSGDGLTSRESEVLGMLRRGYTTAEVADRLKIAPVTVRRHISELVHKLGVENRSGLVLGVARLGRPTGYERSGSQTLNGCRAVRLIVAEGTRRHDVPPGRRR